MIRKATLNDLPAILELVKELAVYEKVPKAVTASLEMYEEAFKEGIFEALVLFKEEKMIGMMLYFMTFSTWKGKMLYLEDFIVTEKHRKKGYGQQLFEALINLAREKKAVLCKWQVLDWNEPAIQFYEKNEAEIEKNWWNGKLFL